MQSGEKLKFVISNDTGKDLPHQGLRNEQREPEDVEFVCSSCGEIFRNTDEHLHKCLDEIKIQPSDSPSPILLEHIEELLTNPQALTTPTNEEYLDEEESRAAISEVSAEEYEVMEYDTQNESFIDIKSSDIKPFLCFYCGKPFASRSVSVHLT